MMRHFSLLASMVFTISTANAANFLTVEGRLTDAAGIIPIEAASVTFHLDIYSPAPTSCLLYSESHVVNMSGSKGYFNLALGQGSRSGVNFEDTSSLLEAMDNSQPMTPTSCVSGSTFTPTTDASRFLEISYDSGSGLQVLSQKIEIGAVQYSNYAQTLQGKVPTDFVQINSSVGYELSQTNLEQVFESSNFTELLALLSGTSSNYISSSGFSSALNLNSQKIENVATPTAGTDATNKTYVDSNIGGAAANSSLSSLGAPESGQVLVWNGSEWTASVPTGDATKLPLSGGVMTGAIDMGNNSITNANSININNGLTVASGIGVTGGINSNGNIEVQHSNELRFGDSDNSNFLIFKAPTSVASNATWTLPDADGSSGQFLQTNGSGVLSFASMGINIGTSPGDAMGADSVPNCAMDEKLEMSSGPVYTWSCVPAGLGDHIATQNIQLGSFWLSGDGGNEGVFVDSSGMVGIGSNFPTFKLDVSGNAKIQGTTNAVQLTVQANASQTANVFEVRDSAGFVVASVNNTGSAANATDLVNKSHLDSTIGGLAIGTPLANSVDSSKIMDGTITAADLAASSVDSSKIIDGTINTIDIANDAITAVKLADSPVAAGTYGSSTMIPQIDIDSKGRVIAASAFPFSGFSADGSTPMTGSLDMNAQAINNLAMGTASTPSLNFTGDSNTGIFSPSPDKVSISTAGIERLTVDSVGGVGIGVSAPRAALEVNGTILSRDIATASGTIIDFANGNIQYTDETCSAPLQLHNLKNGGKYTLVVRGTSSTACIFNSFSGAGTGSMTQYLPPNYGPKPPGEKVVYEFTVIGGENYVTWGGPGTNASFHTNTPYVLKNGQSGPALNIGTNDSQPVMIKTNNTTKLTIDPAGNVGIGTVSPEATFHVNGFVKLQRYGTAPVTCDASNAGVIVLTNVYQACVCNGTAWKQLSDGTSVCTWN